MKKIVLLLLLGFQLVNAQTGIGTSTPHASAKLDVSATDKGFLPPRVTLTSVTDATTIPSPATGLLVYNNGTVGLQAGYYYWNGSRWATIATASSPDQTVDYVSVTRTTVQTVNEGGNILFNQINGGNIPYNTSTGLFTLIAGKTYRLTGCVAISSSNASAEEINVQWKNGNGDLLPNKGEALSTNFGTTGFANGVADVIYTPSVNTTVSLTVTYSSGSVIIWGNFTYANIQQIGSSAIVNPWVLNGNDVYNTTGNVGIGTTTPNASALLDLSSTTQGVLIPRMTASQRNAIPSPTTGLLIFQTDASTGFYYYNGSSWMSISEPNWISAGTIQSVGWGATTTAPTIGTTAINDYSYKQIGAKTWKCQLTYSAGGGTGATIGSGDYLFTLPNGLQFDTSIAGQETYADLVGSSSWYWPGRWLSSSSGSITNLNQGGLLYVVPYSSTQFRLIHIGIAGVGFVIPYASGYYGVGGNLGWRVTFTFQSL